MPLPLLWHTHWNWCNLLCIHSEVYYTSLLTYFSMNSQLHIHAHVAPHVQCVYYLLVKRIAHRYPALKSRSVPWDVLRTVWFSPALGSSCLSPATLALNETSTCTGHSLLLLIEQLAWRATPALLPFSPLSLRPFTFSLLPAVGFTSAHLHFFFLADGTTWVSAPVCTAWTVHLPSLPFLLCSSSPSPDTAEQISPRSAPTKSHQENEFITKDLVCWRWRSELYNSVVVTERSLVSSCSTQVGL